MAEAGLDIGTTLRETRMRARIDIGEVEMRTKIRAKYLRAIENEEWDLLPGPVYVKSFLRTYGDYLGLDSRQLVDEYKRRYEMAPDVHGRPLATVKREREREREQQRQFRVPALPAIPSWAIIGVILAIVVVAIIVVGTSGSSSPKSPTSLAVNTQSGSSRHHRGGGGTGKSGGTTVGRTSTTATGTTTTTATAATKATLKIVPTSDIWVCIENGAGKPVIVGGKDYSPGETVPTESGSTLLVGLGNANATITVDGKAYHPASIPIGLKITAAGASTLPSVPGCAQPS